MSTCAISKTASLALQQVCGQLAKCSSPEEQDGETGREHCVCVCVCVHACVHVCMLICHGGGVCGWVCACVHVCVCMHDCYQRGAECQTTIRCPSACSLSALCAVP